MHYIGIDIGTSNIKIIEIDEKLNIENKMILEKMAPKKAIKKFIEENNINLENIEKIIVTGVGSNNIENYFIDKQVIKVSEFLATGSIEENCIIVSAGTGTAFLKNENGRITHLGGTGVGGGTLINLCKKIKPDITFEDINKAELTGSLQNVDLTIKDVTEGEIIGLPKDTTAVNFGKLNENATQKDLILGVINMVFEIIGVMAAISAKGANIKKIVVIGQIAKIPYARKVFNKIEKLHNVKFEIPENAEYGTAIGTVKLGIYT